MVILVVYVLSGHIAWSSDSQHIFVLSKIVINQFHVITDTFFSEWAVPYQRPNNFGSITLPRNGIAFISSRSLTSWD